MQVAVSHTESLVAIKRNSVLPYTVWGAFDQFRKQTVDLDADETKRARSSRDHLFDQIKKLAANNSYFPKLGGSHIPFGSFARNTKVRPLDDIDILVLLNGKGTRDNQAGSDTYGSWLKITEPDAPLAIFRDQYGYVNSIKILNVIRDSLSKVPNYRRADLHRNQQAVTLDLLSYPWVFDIVPAVPISDGIKTIHYLIPNGRGDWSRTDPRIDSENITKINLHHQGEFLPVIRLLKYWNNRTVKPVLSSYYFETLAIKVFSSISPIRNHKEAIKYFFDICPAYISSSCPDPKRLGPNLDTDISSDTKTKVIAAMKNDSQSADYALMYERLDNEKDAIYWWERVFGSGFPSYG
jgi:hypothetical protein